MNLAAIFAARGDTNLKGAVVNGRQITADIGGNLNIESLQDASTYASKQESISVTGGAGASASQTKINGNYASVRTTASIAVRAALHAIVACAGGNAQSSDCGSNITSHGSSAGLNIDNAYDETVLGSSLKAGGNTSRFLSSASVSEWGITLTATGGKSTVQEPLQSSRSKYWVELV
ncbi:MAG: hypothetical protein FD173_2282 [Gallionellaceae bacterium]|nr:MAG: hypothetical protein FD173_2282 [Gallionellaceae bacterium]